MFAIAVISGQNIKLRPMIPSAPAPNTQRVGLSFQKTGLFKALNKVAEESIAESKPLDMAKLAV